MWTLTVDENGRPSEWQLHQQNVQFKNVAAHPKHPEWVAALADSAPCFGTTDLEHCSQDVRPQPLPTSPFCSLWV